jgi:hypothetical protein
MGSFRSVTKARNGNILRKIAHDYETTLLVPVALCRTADSRPEGRPRLNDFPHCSLLEPCVDSYSVLLILKCSVESIQFSAGRTTELEHDGKSATLGPVIDPEALIAAIR